MMMISRVPSPMYMPYVVPLLVGRHATHDTYRSGFR
jgi:isocitrate dehydrogenase